MNTKMKLFLLCISTLSVDSSTFADTWTQLNDFAGIPKRNAASFVINSKGYLCGGWNSSAWTNDCWEYDPLTDSWTQKATLTYPLYDLAIGGQVNNKGYLIQMTGNMIANTYSYEYDPISNSWTTKTQCPAIERTFPAGAIINNKLYCGFGSSISGNIFDYADWWQYDPSTDSWSQKANFPGNPRFGTVVFAINNKVYAGAGGSVNGLSTNDFYEYNPLTNTWTQKASLGNSIRYLPSVFVINNRGYVCAGNNNMTPLKELFEYDPVMDSWIQKTDFPRFTYASASFTINGIAYMGLGSDPTSIDEPVGWYKYIPDPTGVSENAQASNSFLIFPNPAKDLLHIKCNSSTKNLQFKIFNSDGKAIMESLVGHSGDINIQKLNPGKYFLKLKTGSVEVANEFVKL